MRPACTVVFHKESTLRVAEARGSAEALTLPRAKETALSFPHHCSPSWPTFYRIPAP